MRYIEHNSWGDCRAPVITGLRPMTKEEISEVKKADKEEKREEIKELKRLARKYKYTLTKIQ